MDRDRLRAYRAILQEIKQLEEIKRDVETRGLAPKVPQLTGLPGAPSADHDKIGALVARTADLTAHYAERIAALHEEQIAIEEAVDRLRGYERIVIRYRYLQGKSWREIMTLVPYCYTRLQQIHRHALERLEGMG